MDKKGASKGFIWVIVVLVAIFLVYSIASNSATKTINQHKTPADISQSQNGTGLDLKLFDSNGKPITIPDWFKAASIVDMGGFTIVTHPPAPTCTTVSNCAGYLTNPNIMCWQGSCVLGNVASMSMGVSVTNPSSSQISFLNVAPSTVAPVAFNTALDKTPVATLAPGQTHSWTTTTTLSLAPWQGTTQTFSVTVGGTNQYTGAVTTATDSMSLAFAADPTGAFTVSVVSPI